MRKSVLAGFGLAALAFLPAAGAVAQTGTPWIHVRVEEAKKQSKVRVNLPLSVVEAALKAAPEIVEKEGKLNIGGHHDLSLADMRKVWKELAAAGDAEIVTVESPDENVRVMRKGNMVQVFVDNKPAAGKTVEAGKAPKAAGQVRVEVPVSLVDALLSGEGETVNIKAAIAEIQKLRGDIVQVHDEDANVRIWIDEQNAQTAQK
jgi:hypothetical protein